MIFYIKDNRVFAAADDHSPLPDMDDVKQIQLHGRTLEDVYTLVLMPELLLVDIISLRKAIQMPDFTPEEKSNVYFGCGEIEDITYRITKHFNHDVPPDLKNDVAEWRKKCMATIAAAPEGDNSNVLLQLIMSLLADASPLLKAIDITVDETTMNKMLDMTNSSDDHTSKVLYNYAKDILQRNPLGIDDVIKHITTFEYYGVDILPLLKMDVEITAPEVDVRGCIISLAGLCDEHGVEHMTNQFFNYLTAETEEGRNTNLLASHINEFGMFLTTGIINLIKPSMTENDVDTLVELVNITHGRINISDIFREQYASIISNLGFYGAKSLFEQVNKELTFEEPVFGTSESKIDFLQYLLDKYDTSILHTVRRAINDGAWSDIRILKEDVFTAANLSGDIANELLVAMNTCDREEVTGLFNGIAASDNPNNELLFIQMCDAPYPLLVDVAATYGFEVTDSLLAAYNIAGKANFKMLSVLPLNVVVNISNMLADTDGAKEILDWIDTNCGVIDDNELNTVEYKEVSPEELGLASSIQEHIELV